MRRGPVSNGCLPWGIEWFDGPSYRRARLVSGHLSQQQQDQELIAIGRAYLK
jgi:hypothetical protein